MSNGVTCIMPSTLLERHKLEAGAANQGLALTKDHDFSATSSGTQP